MKTKSKILFGLLVVLLSYNMPVYPWGKTGHRVVGLVAQRHLKKSVLKKIEKLLNHRSLAQVANYADEIKSDPRYRRFYPWHFTNFEPGEKYDTNNPNPKGDVIYAIKKCKQIILDSKSSKKDKSFYLKLLIHFVGDIHQPLHLGRHTDLGGNKIKVYWFNKHSNLHRVWDENMIDFYKMSYTELANDLPYLTKEQQKQIENATLMDWVYQSRVLADKIYTSAKQGDHLGYHYQYNYFAIVKMQLEKAGLRLAKLLNDLFS